MRLKAYIYPELLHSIKALILSTNGLASILVYHKLHRFINFKPKGADNDAELKQINEYIRKKDFNLKFKQWTWMETIAPPKFLADTMEALCGAIFVDGGWEAIMQVFLRMTAPMIFFMCSYFDEIVIDLTHDIIVFFGRLRTIDLPRNQVLYFRFEKRRIRQLRHNHIY